MFKRLFALCIVVAMMTSMVPCVYAADTAETSVAEESAELLSSLGIISGEANSGLRANATVTGFLQAVSVIVGNENADVRTTLQYLNMKTNIDINEQVTRSFASEVLVRLLGYGDIAQYVYNSEQYKLQAQKLKLFSGIESGKTNMTNGDVYVMLANALETEMLAITGVEVGNDGTTQNVMSNYGTALYYYMHIFKVRGILNETSGASLYGESSLDDNEVKIGSYIFADNGADYDVLIGYAVEAYVKDGKDEDTIVFINKGDNKELEIAHDDFVGYNALSGVLTYFSNNGRQTSTTLNADVAIVYNGTGVQSFDENIFKQKNGKITLIDNDRDGRFDVASIEAYAHMVVASANSATYEITNMMTYTGALQKIKLDSENEKHKITIVKDGVKISFADISRRAVLRVYENPNNPQQIIRIYVSENMLSGSITSKRSDDEIIGIDGTEYTVSKNYLDAIGKKNASGIEEKYAPQLEMGKAYTFYIDDLGEIVAADKDIRNSYKYGYMTSVAKSDEAFESTVKIRLFDEGGKVQIYEFAEKLEYNKQPKIKAETAYAQLAVGGTVTPQLVAYKLNKDKEIIKLYTAVAQNAATDEDVLVKGEKVSAAFYNTNYATFNDGKNPIFINPSNIIWLAPKDINASSCTIMTMAALYNTTHYTVTPYNMDEYSGASVFVMEDDDNLKNARYIGGALFILTEKSTIMTNDGEIKAAIEGVSNHFTSMNLSIADDALGTDLLTGQNLTSASLESGDVLTPIVDTNGDIKEFKRWFTLSEKGKTASLSTASAVWSHGTVKSIDSLYNRMIVTIGTTEYNLQFMPNCRYYVYEDYRQGANVTARQGTISDLVEGDYVAFRSSYRNIEEIVIYKGGVTQ